MSATATIPFSLLYAALLPSDCARLSPRAQLFRFERVLAVPVDSLQVARTVLPDRQVLLVGIEQERLRRHLGDRSDIGPLTWRLVPEAAPPHLVAAGVSPSDLERLNLLHGIFEPAPRRRRRLACTTIAHAGWIVVAALVLAGGELRARAIDRRSDEIRSATRAAVAQVIPPHVGVPPEAALTMELRALEQAAHDAGPADADIAAALTALWRAWPRDVRVQIESVAAAGGRIVVRGKAAALVDVETLAQATPEIAASSARYRIEPLQAQNADGGATFLLTWQRREVVR